MVGAERELRDAVIAEIHAITRYMIEDPEFELEELEDGIELETPKFVLRLSIDTGDEG